MLTTPGVHSSFPSLTRFALPTPDHRTEALGVGSTIECVPAAMQGPTGGSTAKDPETAWPCDAPGPGQRLAAGFQMDEFVVRDADAGVEVARVGMLHRDGI